MQVLVLSFQNCLEQVLNLVIMLKVDTLDSSILTDVTSRLIKVVDQLDDGVLSYVRAVLSIRKLNYLMSSRGFVTEEIVTNALKYLPPSVPFLDDFNGFTQALSEKTPYKVLTR